MDPNEKGQDQNDTSLTEAVGDAEFDNAFAEFSDPESVQSDPEPETEEPAPEPSPEVDPWASAPEDLRAAYQAAREDAAQWQQRYRSDAGRVTAYQRQVEQLQKDMESAKKGVNAQAAEEAAQDAAEFLDDPEFKAFREEYPEVAKPIEKVMKSLQAKAERLEREFGTISGERRDQMVAKQEELLSQYHPDWKEATSSPQFVQWYHSATPGLRADIERHGSQIGDAQEVAKILDTFKSATGYGRKQAAQPGVTNLSAKRARQLESATAPAGRGLGAASGAPDDFEAAFNHYTRKTSQSR